MTKPSLPVESKAKIVVGALATVGVLVLVGLIVSSWHVWWGIFITVPTAYGVMSLYGRYVRNVYRAWDEHLVEELLSGLQDRREMREQRQWWQEHERRSQEYERRRSHGV